MMRWKVLSAFGLVAGAVFVAIACDDEHRRTPPGKFGGGACHASPGELPDPACDNSEQICSGQPSESRPGCAIDETRCGSKSTCLPLADNKGKDVADLRIRRLNIAAPEALAGALIQNVVVNTGIELAEPSCAENGNGLFSWLLRVDTKGNTVLTGGGAPSTDPAGKGYCFARFTLAGTNVEPIRARIERNGTTFKTVEPLDVNIPIFLSEKLESAIILPISGARVEGVTLSPDGNCIGQFNGAALDPSCSEDRSLCQKWTTAGALGGYITLEQAEAVKITTLDDKSLCAYLASETKSCARDASGKIIFRGDYCSAENSPGSCADSVWLAATFAASAAKIVDGEGTLGCSGESAGPIDASADAPHDAPDDG
jgi:hypothetical protein